MDAKNREHQITILYPPETRILDSLGHRMEADSKELETKETDDAKKSKDKVKSSKVEKVNDDKEQEGVTSKDSKMGEVKTNITKGKSSNEYPVKVVKEKPNVVGKSVDEVAKSDEVHEEVGFGKKLLTVQDIIDALSIIVHSSKNITSEKPFAFVSSVDMEVEMPKEVEKLDSELFFQGDNTGRWSIMYNKIRFSNATEKEVSDYPPFIQHLRHIIMGTAKEFFRIFRISQKLN